MPLEIQPREREGIQILDLAGRLTMGPEDELFHETMDGCLKKGQAKIALNCARLEAMDSAGVDDLVFFHTELRKAGGKLALFSLTRAHMELFILLKLDTVFEAYPDEQDAVNSFFPDRAVKHYDILKFVQEMEGGGK